MLATNAACGGYNVVEDAVPCRGRAPMLAKIAAEVANSAANLCKDDKECD